MAVHIIVTVGASYWLIAEIWLSIGTRQQCLYTPVYSHWNKLHLKYTLDYWIVKVWTRIEFNSNLFLIWPGFNFLPSFPAHHTVTSCWPWLPTHVLMSDLTSFPVLSLWFQLFGLIITWIQPTQLSFSFLAYSHDILYHNIPAWLVRQEVYVTLTRQSQAG